MMSSQSLPTPIRSDTTGVNGITTRGRGRPMTTNPTSLDEALVEVRAMRAELREMADEVIPLSAYLWKRAAIDGDPKAKAAAGRVVYLAKRLSERGTPPEAA